MGVNMNLEKQKRRMNKKKNRIGKYVLFLSTQKSFALGLPCIMICIIPFCIRITSLTYFIIKIKIVNSHVRKESSFNPLKYQKPSNL